MTQWIYVLVIASIAEGGVKGDPFPQEVEFKTPAACMYARDVTLGDSAAYRAAGLEAKCVARRAKDSE